MVVFVIIQTADTATAVILVLVATAAATTVHAIHQSGVATSTLLATVSATCAATIAVVAVFAVVVFVAGVVFIAVVAVVAGVKRMSCTSRDVCGWLFTFRVRALSLALLVLISGVDRRANVSAANPSPKFPLFSNTNLDTCIHTRLRSTDWIVGINLQWLVAVYTTHRVITNVRVTRCMRVRMHVRIYACTHVRMYACTRAWMILSRARAHA